MPIHAWWVATLYSHLASGGRGKPTYKVDCSLCTYKCVDERRKGETHVHACSPHLARPSGAWRGVGEARRWVWVHDVHVNSPLKSSPKPHRSATSFCRLFFYRVCVEYVLIEIDIVGYETL
jgi:hypothetical protein